jgi:hypothetical protein
MDELDHDSLLRMAAFERVCYVDQDIMFTGSIIDGGRRGMNSVRLLALGPACLFFGDV